MALHVRGPLTAAFIAGTALVTIVQVQHNEAPHPAPTSTSTTTLARSASHTDRLTPREPSAAFLSRPIVISLYRDCEGRVAECMSAGTLSRVGHTLQGSDGYQWLAQLSIGRRVVVADGVLRGVYRVTGHEPAGEEKAALVLRAVGGRRPGVTTLARVS